MNGVNTAIVVGNLGADPELKEFSNGGRVVNLSIATSESWTDKKTGEKQERTEWHRIVVRRQHTQDYLMGNAHKGDTMSVTGKLQTRKWTGSDGIDRWTTEIAADDVQTIARANPDSGSKPKKSQPDLPAVEDDDIPF